MLEQELIMICSTRNLLGLLPVRYYLRSILKAQLIPKLISGGWILLVQLLMRYRDTTFITDISSLTSIGSSSSSSFIDTITSPNIYYYAVVAVSDYGDSILSNVVYVEILDESDARYETWSNLPEAV